MEQKLFVGLDVHKRNVSVGLAEDGRTGEVRFLGDFENTPVAIENLMRRLAKRDHLLDFCYEAGPCGYGIYRQLTGAGHECSVVAPSKIAVSPGDRVKTDRRDAQRLAVLHRSGELTPVWVPDSRHEAMRDLIRARLDAVKQLTTARHQLSAFLLRHGRHYTPNRKPWTKIHSRWLGDQSFDEPAQQIVFQDYIQTVWTAAERRDAMVRRIEELIPDWSLGEFVYGLRCFRGLDLVSAATLVANIGDIGRFDSPRQLMSFLGLTPSEYSSGGTIRRGAITKTGNREARRMLIEAAWSYRYPAKVAQQKARVIETQPKCVRDIAWRAQERLCNRYRSLHARGKKIHCRCRSNRAGTGRFCVGAWTRDAAKYRLRPRIRLGRTNG